jgi:hypothetical protein
VEDLISREFATLSDQGYDAMTVKQLTLDAQGLFDSKKYSNLSKLITSTASELPLNVEVNQLVLDTVGRSSSLPDSPEASACTYGQTRDYFAEFCPDDKEIGDYSLRLVDKNQDLTALEEGDLPDRVEPLDDVFMQKMLLGGDHANDISFIGKVDAEAWNMYTLDDVDQTLEHTMKAANSETYKVTGYEYWGLVEDQDYAIVIEDFKKEGIDEDLN